MKLRTGSILLIVALATIVAYLGNRLNSANTERDAWMRTAAQRDTLHQIEAGRYQRAAVELDNERQLRAVLADSLPKLLGELNDLRAEVQQYVRVIATMEADTASVSATDTVYVEQGTSVSRVDFALSFDGCTIKGYTRTPPPYAEGIVSYAPIPLSIVISELRDGSLRTNVETAPWIKIDQLNTSFVRKKPSWFARKLPWIAFGAGYILGLFGGG